MKKRTPNIQSFFVAAPSFRKSSLFRFVSTSMFDNDYAPDELRHGLCTCADGSIKGHRTNLHNYARSGLATDEVSSAYKTHFSEDTTGLHFASRQKMCTFVNCEIDSSVTGHDPAHFSEYSFYHLVYGQIDPIEEVLKPSGSEFSKQFNVVMAATASAYDSNPAGYGVQEFSRRLSFVVVQTQFGSRGCRVSANAGFGGCSSGAKAPLRSVRMGDDEQRLESSARLRRGSRCRAFANGGPVLPAES